MSEEVKVIKTKKEIPTVIEYKGNIYIYIYVLRHPNQGGRKPKDKK